MSVKKDPLVDLLGSEDKEEQVKKIQSLVKAATAPIVFMTIVIDTRTGETQVAGTDMPFEVAYRFLDQARAHLLSRERSMFLQDKQEGEV